jgi:GNAT superfamily N-acetyltransferase
VDRQLIRDHTYFVVEAAGIVVGCGGWSRRKFFVRPGYERRGIGSLIMQASERAAAAEGFTRLELRATLTGVPLYRKHRFVEVEMTRIPLPSGDALPAVQMVKVLR